jgi:hypothetical protein
MVVTVMIFFKLTSFKNFLYKNTAAILLTYTATIMYDINDGENLNLAIWKENITESIDGVSKTKKMKIAGLTINPWLKYLFKIFSLVMNKEQHVFFLVLLFSGEYVLDVLRSSYKIKTTTMGIKHKIVVNPNKSCLGNSSKNNPPRYIATIVEM